jgi:heterodisulfide reductase subunit B
VFRLLGVVWKELTDWNCCGAQAYMSVDAQESCLLAARNLRLAYQSGSHDVVAPCSACYLALRKCKDYMARYPEMREAASEFLHSSDLPAIANVRVRHALDMLYGDIGPDAFRARSVRPWSGGKVVCYYGCQAVRPYGEVDHDPNPMRMDQLLEAAGIPVATFPLKTKCCGSSHTGTLHDVGVRLCYLLLKEAVRRGAEAIVTICPMCQFNLDVYQKDAARESGESFDMPVLFLPQALGWTLGADFRALGLHRALSGGRTLQRWFHTSEGARRHG